MTTHEFTADNEAQLSAQETLQVGAEFLQHFEVAADPVAEHETFMSAMAQLDPRYQGGRDLVRYELENDQTAWPEDTKTVIMGAAEGMHMLKPETPVVGQFDYVIALGGARQANLDRARYAVQAATNGMASFNNLIVAGSTRKLQSAEQENAANYAPGAQTEADLCAGAAKAVQAEAINVPVSSFEVEGEKASTPVIIETVLAALRNNGELREGMRIGVVTTQIYQQSTALDAARIGKQFGVDTFTAGNPSDPAVVAKRTPATYQSEVLRTLKAAATAIVAKQQ